VSSSHLDLTNAVVQSVTYLPFLADIRRSVLDREIKGTSVWMMLWWLSYSIWCGFIAQRLKLPITSVVILIGIVLYSIRVILAFYYTFVAIKVMAAFSGEQLYESRIVPVYDGKKP